MSEVGSSTPAAAGSSSISPANQSVMPENSAGVGNHSQEKSSAAEKAARERIKHTIDGEEVEEEVDWNDRDTLKKRLQLAHAAEKRMREAKHAKSKAFDIVKQFESDPISILKRLPDGKGRELAEKFLLEQINIEMLTPEQKRIRELEQYQQATESEKKQAKERAEKDRQDRLSSEFAEKFQKTIIEALDKSGLPKTPALVKQMAGLLKKKMDLGIELDASDLVDLAKNDTQKLLKSIIADADGAQLIAMFGSDVANKIRKYDLKTLQEKQNQFLGTTNPQQTGEAKKEAKTMTMTEWKESLDKRFSK